MQSKSISKGNQFLDKDNLKTKKGSLSLFVFCFILKTFVIITHINPLIKI